MSAVKNVVKDNYNMMLLKDYLREKIKDAGFSKVEISKTPMGTRIALHVTRPGIVIGRKGVGIRELTETLGTKFGLKNPQLSVVEIAKPELSPNVMCNRLASHLERGTAFRRATMWTLNQIMEAGAMGVQITVSGKLRGDRSAFEKHTVGVLPRAGHHADEIVEEDIAHVKTPMGLIGVRIRIARKEKLIPEFELKEKAKTEQVKPIVEEKEIEIKDVSSEETSEDTTTEKTSEDTTIEKTSEDTTTEKTSEDTTEKTPEELKEQTGPKTESEQILQDSEKMKELETLEEEEEKLK